MRPFFIEQDLTEETFVASDLESSSGGTSYTLSGNNINVSHSSIAQVDLTAQFSKSVYTFSGGQLQLAGTPALNADIIRGTMECDASGSFVFSVYAGTITGGETTAQSGLITISGSLQNFTCDIIPVVEEDITSLEGTKCAFRIISASLFVTQNAGDYQRYSVQMELLEYARGVLSDVSTPTYEFDVDSGNFLFAQDFSPFRNAICLGNACYLRLQNGEVINPILIEMKLDFEDLSKFTLGFSNRFKRHDAVNTLRDMIESGYSSSRNFDASKYIYNQTASVIPQVTKFMESSLDAAVNTIIGAENQSVRIDGAGIHIGGDSDCQIRIVNSMIALTDDSWQHAKIGIGLFSSPDIGTYFGVNADVIGGKLFVGNNLVIENSNDQGVMQFKVDASGAWLYNSTFVMAKDAGGKLLLDPAYGFVAGNGNLYTVDGTTVRPSFIDSSGKIIVDRYGLPQNANFFIDARTGDAYFRGKIYAEDGVFNGTVYAEDGVFNGTVYANDGRFTGTVYATDGSFTGKIVATSGEFTGTIKAATLSGKITGSSGGAIEGVSLNIGNGAFTVDRSGNVVIKSGSISWGAVTGTDEIDNRIDAA